MKIVKDIEHGLLLKHFNANDKDYLCITSMLYFDLLENAILKEQDMWKEVIPFLREEEPLDFSMPKQKAEFLAYGNAYSKIPTKAQEVGIMVGNIAKKLYVVGDRYYSSNSAGLIYLSEPEPFTKKRVGFANAYGGASYAKNPIGTGYFSVLELGAERIKAPNIQSTKNIAIDNAENLSPESFEPLGIDFEFRVKKAGTYNEDWKVNRWPYFPIDMDYDIFNAALPNQWSKEYFIGNEEIVIENMHKEFDTIKSKLPSKAVKTFVTKIKKTDYYSDEILEEEFFEVENKIDTVILFTDIARAVIVFRATVEVIDDEYSNIANCFFKTQDLYAKPKDLVYYKELLDKQMDKAVDIDASQVKLKEDLTKTAKNLADMPLKFEAELKKLKGETPSVSASPKTSLDNGIALFGQMQSSFDDIATNGVLEKFLLKNPAMSDTVGKSALASELDASFRKSFGIAATNLKNANPISSLSTLYTLPQQIIDNFKISKETMSGINLPKGEKGAPFGKLLDSSDLGAKLQQELDDANGDMNIFFIKSWSDGASYFVGDTKTYLESLGILEDIKKCHLRDVNIELSNICYNREKAIIKANRWKQEKEFIIDKGFILPFFDKSEIKKLVIRPKLLDENDKFIGDINDKEVDGSSDCELVLAGDNSKIVIIVSDFIEAWLINQDVWDFANVVLFKDEASFYASKFYGNNKDEIKHIFSFYFSFQTKQEILKYTKIELERNIIEDYSSVNFRQIIINALDEGELKTFLQKEERRKKRMGLSYVAPFDIENYTAKMKDIIESKTKENIKKNEAEINSAIKKHTDSLQPKAQEMMNEAKNKKMDLTADEVGKKSKEELEKMKKYAEAKYGKNSDLAQKIDLQLSHLESPEFKRLSGIQAEVESELAIALKDVPGKIEFPDWAKKRFQKAFGKDIDAITLKFKTFDEVKTHYDEKLSFYCSEFQGIDFENCEFKDTSFRECKLGGVRFKNAVFTNIDMSKSILSGVLFEDCYFELVNLSGNDFSGAEFINSKFINCNFDKAIMKGCVFNNSKIENSSLQDVMAPEIQAENSSFNGSSFKDAIISDANLKSITFIDSILSDAIISTTKIYNCNFSGSDISKAIFSKSEVVASSFDNANLNRLMLVQDSVFTSINAIESKFTGGAFLGAKLKGCNFSNANLSDSYINKSAFEECKLDGANAKSLRIERSALKNCSMNKTNFMLGSFRKSRMDSVDLSSSNLFATDFFGLKVSKLDLRGSNLKLTHLTPDRLATFKEVDSDYR